MNYTISRILSWIVDHKLVTFLSICLFAFVIATISLASVKNSLEEEINQCKHELSAATKPTKKPTTTTEKPSHITTTTEKSPESTKNTDEQEIGKLGAFSTQEFNAVSQAPRKRPIGI